MNKKYFFLFLALVFFTGLIMLLVDFFLLIYFEYPFSRLIVRFGIPALIFLVVYCGILGRNAGCFDGAFFSNKNNSLDSISDEEFDKRLKKLGAIPIKIIALNIVLHAAFLGIIFSRNYLGLEPAIKGPMFMAALSFGMLVGTFVYVMSDGLVSLVLIHHNLTHYPDALREKRQELKAMIIPVVASLVSLIFGCAVAMLAFIRAGVASPETISSAFSAALILMVIFYLFIVYLSINLKKNTSRLYTLIIKQLENLSSDQKDLSQRIKIVSVDELGTIAGMVNTFCIHLGEGISDIKGGQKKLAEVGTKLEDNVSVMVNSVSQISGAAEQVLLKTQSQIESVNTASKAVRDTAVLIGNMEEAITSQTSSMAQGSSAVEQMVGNISSIGVVTEKMTTQFRTVGEASEEGRRIQNESKERINTIVEQSHALQEANKIIATIAAQTNLLAMNAAIEAAHAGEAGKGFSVVSDAIRKLAENSSTESRKINIELKQIVETINHIVKDAEASENAFTEVSRRINETEKLVIEVDHAIREQKTGASQVMESLKVMNDTNVKVTDYSGKMSKGNETMLWEIDTLHDSAVEIATQMEEVSKSIKEVETGSQEVSKLAAVSHSSVEIISDIAGAFRV